MIEYMAELITYRLPPLEERMYELKKISLTSGHRYSWHMSLPKDSSYFVKLRDDICNEIGVESTGRLTLANSISAPGMSQNYQNKHVDNSRLAAVSIPCSEFTDPIHFYAENGEPDWYRKYSPNDLLYQKYDAIPVVYTGYYPRDYPTLTRVSTLHNIPENTKKETRIMFQLDFQVNFDTIIATKPEAWKFIPGQRYT